MAIEQSMDMLRADMDKVEDYLITTELSRMMAERNRDYKDNKQWTREEEAKLRRRGQAAIVNNRVKPKVEGLKGLLVQRRTDPKAYPRTPKHEQASQVVTDGLRFVNDNTDLDQIEVAIADNYFVEGTGAAIVDINEKKNGEKEIDIQQIPWDRYFYDIHSRKLDFSDKTYDGIMLWMDVDQAKQTFPGNDEMIENAGFSFTDIDETFEDRPRWTMGKSTRMRIRVVHMFKIENDTWMESYFCSGGYLQEPEPSSYHDEDGEPHNPIEAQSAYIDRDNNRFGEVEYWIDQQDEINHRHSKFLHFLSSRQTFGKRGEQKDIAKIKAELKKPDGHVEFDEGEWGKDFGTIPTGDMASAQFTILQEQKAEMDSTSFSAQLAGDRQDGNLSGVAINRLQSASVIELASLYDGLASWKKRIYRQIWYRMKQHWTEEKWIRVTDDRTKIRWVGFNAPISMQERLEEVINDESEEVSTRRRAAQIYTEMLQAQDPRLQEVVEIRNNLPELDVDIILEQSVDSINTQNEQFALLAKLSEGRQEIPFTALLQLSQLRGKDELIKKIEEREQAVAQFQQQQLEQQQQQTQLQLQLLAGKTQSEIGEKDAKATNLHMDTVQKQIENDILVNPNVPDIQKSVSV